MLFPDMKDSSNDLPIPEINQEEVYEIDWTNPAAKVTKHFAVKDACRLDQWNRLATADDGMDTAKLTTLCEKMEEVRDVLSAALGRECPIDVHCMFRSVDYNKLIGGSKNSPHIACEACDFSCSPELTIQQIKDILEPKLAELGIRMERGTTTWVHIDVHPVKYERYFNP